MEDTKLQRLGQIMEVLDKDTVTQEEFVEYFGQLISFVQKLKDSNDEHLEEVEEHAEEYMNKCMVTMEQEYASEWAKIKEKVASLRNGNDYVLTESDKQEIAEMIIPPMFETPERIIERIETPVIKEVALKDTPEQLVEKVNTSKVKINREQIDGLKDIENMAKSNAMPVTTTHFYRDGVSFGRAKNINMIGAKVEVIGDQGYITPITVSDTAPENPFLNQLWLDTA